MTKIKGKPAKPPWKGVYWWKREDHIGPVWRLDVWCEAQITLEKDVSIKPWANWWFIWVDHNDQVIRHSDDIPLQLWLKFYAQVNPHENHTTQETKGENLPTIREAG